MTSQPFVAFGDETVCILEPDRATYNRYGVKRGLKDASKLRVDTAVVETDIRYPCDSGLLWGTVRVPSTFTRLPPPKIGLDSAPASLLERYGER